jgi:hypothetical protein
VTGPTGWWPDPSGRHPFRYFEDGQPTHRVSEQRVVTGYMSSDAQHRYWDGLQWMYPAPTPSSVTSEPTEEVRPSRGDRRRRPPSVITIAEALVIALTLIAVITFAFMANGPAHSAARTEAPGPTSAGTTTSPSTTIPASAALPSVSEDLDQWWAGTGGPKSSALAADLASMQGDGANTAQLAVHCTTFTTDATAANSGDPAPSTSIEREWQLTLSTSQRVSAACAAQQYTRVNTDLQPALYTIRDLTHQIGPYLSRGAP